MIHYVVYDPSSGEILRSGQCQPDSLPYQGEHVLSVEHDCSDNDNYVQGGLVMAYTEAQRIAKMNPRPGLRWSNLSMQWEESRSLGQARQEKNAEINRNREAANSTTFVFQGKAIAVDRVAKDDISGVTQEVALTNALPANFPGAWKSIDNTYVPIPNVETWRQFVQAMVAQGTVNFARSQALKALVAQATSLAEIEAIHWNMPLPAP